MRCTTTSRSARLGPLALGILLALAAPAGAAERAIQLRTIEDPSLLDAAFCAAQRFGPQQLPPNVLLGGGAWSAETRASDGEVVNEHVRQVGSATVCARLADLTFAPFGAPIAAAARFVLEDGTYDAHGACTITSNSVPVTGLVLASCALAVTAAPAGLSGGSVTSASVFNPRRLPGFDTGSYWTLRLYGED